MTTIFASACSSIFSGILVFLYCCNNLETKFDKFRPKTPQEKLELRSLDSGPFNQKLSDFFQDKEPDMEKSGKNEYVLTTDDANNYSTNDVETSFNNYDDEDTNMM